MPSGEIAANWATRLLKERALTRHSRASGRQRGNIEQNWPFFGDPFVGELGSLARRLRCSCSVAAFFIVFTKLKLFILRSEKKYKNARNAEVRYTPGTRNYHKRSPSSPARIKEGKVNIFSRGRCCLMVAYRSRQLIIPLPVACARCRFTSITAFCGCFGGLGMSTNDFQGFPPSAATEPPGGCKHSFTPSQNLSSRFASRLLTCCRGRLRYPSTPRSLSVPHGSAQTWRLSLFHSPAGRSRR